MYRIWVADLDSPCYFVATAAVELGYFKREGIDRRVRLQHARGTGAVITREAIAVLMKFAKGFGLIPDANPCEALVATEFSALWPQ